MKIRKQKDLSAIGDERYQGKKAFQTQKNWHKNEIGIYQLLMKSEGNSSQGDDSVLRELFELENEEYGQESSCIHVSESQ